MEEERGSRASCGGVVPKPRKAVTPDGVKVTMLLCRADANDDEDAGCTFAVGEGIDYRVRYNTTTHKLNVILRRKMTRSMVSLAAEEERKQTRSFAHASPLLWGSFGSMHGLFDYRKTTEALSNETLRLISREDNTTPPPNETFTVVVRRIRDDLRKARSFTQELQPPTTDPLLPAKTFIDIALPTFTSSKHKDKAPTFPPSFKDDTTIGWVFKDGAEQSERSVKDRYVSAGEACEDDTNRCYASGSSLHSETSSGRDVGGIRASGGEERQLEKTSRNKEVEQKSNCKDVGGIAASETSEAAMVQSADVVMANGAFMTLLSGWCHEPKEMTALVEQPARDAAGVQIHPGRSNLCVETSFPLSLWYGHDLCQLQRDRWTHIPASEVEVEFDFGRLSVRPAWIKFIRRQPRGSVSRRCVGSNALYRHRHDTEVVLTSQMPRCIHWCMMRSHDDVFRHPTTTSTV